MNYIESFINLVKENPTLPVIPMVDNEVVGDEWGRWMGSFGHSEIGEYALYKDRYYEDRESFKEAYYDYNDEELDEQFGYSPYINDWTIRKGAYTQEQYDANEEAAKRIDEYLDKIAEEYFVNAIIVYIDTP